MIYVIDASSFIVLGHYFPARFPSFWQRFDEFTAHGDIVSVKEVQKELDRDVARPHLRDWIASHKGIFLPPVTAETEFVAKIFAVPAFLQLVKQRQTLKSGPCGDPFLIASAMIKSGCVVTEETKRENAIRIPNVCEHFGISCVNLEGLMEREGWTF